MPSPSGERSTLARRLAAAVLVPFVLILALGVLLGRQLLQMSEDARWVDHTDEVIGVANETLKEVIDQETGVRGYLITGDRTFLEPLERAHPRAGFERLLSLVADSPQQVARFTDAQRRYDAWFEYISPALAGHEVQFAKTAAAMGEQKRRMDAVRASVREGVDVEEGLRKERAAASAASVGNTKILLVTLLGVLAVLLAVLSRTQLGAVADTFGAALRAEQLARAEVEVEAWLRAGQAKFTDALQGGKELARLGAEALAALAAYAEADVGALFTQEGGHWCRRAAYGLDTRAGGPDTFALGEGIVGRAAAGDQIVRLKEVPAGFLTVRSGTGEAAPCEIVLVPARVDGATNAVLELGFLKPPSARAAALLERIGESLALAVRAAESRAELARLLEEAQRQAEELQTQQEELRVANEELESQTVALRTTQRQLETQQAEVEQTNESLTRQSALLERQNQDLQDKQAEIESKAREVERASQFKSEFLSNMSHELRTPLNSSLILAKLLADNKDGNLSAEQVKFAETIYGAGNDLLALINDILDLSKIESGKMEVHAASMPIERMRGVILRTFGVVAEQKGLKLSVTVSPSAPAAIETDAQRLEQILKNLVSNAVKFTDRGEVAVEIVGTADRVHFSVRDTGIGIPEAQQGIIFEAFRQADGTTNRKYGGTGLGLSISRELARLLGGEIGVASEAGTGATFTLSLPLVHAGAAPPPESRPRPAPAAPAPPRQAPSAPPPDAPAPAATNGHAHDPEVVGRGRCLVLVIEDEDAFARILLEAALEAGFQCLVATTAEQGLRLARKHLPTGIILDMKLPDHSGLSVLDRLKHDPATRHIPVHVISATDYVETALSMGAAAYLMKPVDRAQILDALRNLEARSTHRLRRVLVVEDDAALRESVARLLESAEVEISTAATVAEALALLGERTFDCVVTDLTLPDQSGFELLETMAAGERYSVPPVIVYTGRALGSDEEQRLRRYSRSIIVKGARSPERLLDEVTLFLHQVESELAEGQRRMLKQARHREAVFEGRTVLVVEDDVRNVFALTSVLEPKGAKVAIARNGREALDSLEKEPRVDLVLMDLMMPEMDGLEATREIRKNPRWAKTPIIALTAKAMRDDQERCLAAGANDYLAKPLDVEVLLSLLRVWMPKAS